MIDFSGRHFVKEIITMAIRWYLSYSLSYRNVEELLAERGYRVDHSTVQRWVCAYSDKLESEFRNNYKKKRKYARWRMDETYITIKGKNYYLYRAIDKEGDTIDFMLSEKRNEDSAFEFFQKAINSHGVPELVNIDKSGGNEGGLLLINIWLMSLGIWPETSIEIRQNKYLNNIIEQDHRNIKRRTRPMLGFKSVESAKSTLAGYELINMLRKGQHIDAANQTVFEQFYALAG